MFYWKNTIYLSRPCFIQLWFLNTEQHPHVEVDDDSFVAWSLLCPKITSVDPPWGFVYMGMPDMVNRTDWWFNNTETWLKFCCIPTSFSPTLVGNSYLLTHVLKCQHPKIILMRPETAGLATGYICNVCKYIYSIYTYVDGKSLSLYFLVDAGHA